MKILCVGDVHWSQNSSIVRSRGVHFSTRLENLITSVNWAENIGWENGCNVIVYMGDFFDSTQLNSEEISALSYIKWAPVSHIFITGNHESSISSLEYNTSDLFKLCPNSTVITKPEYDHVAGTDVEFAFLPYILEQNRKPLEEYFPKPTEKRIIFSHNDLKDVQYGQFLSTEGFTINEIEESCDLFVNGHIHNCSYVTSKILNCGNLTGQNFTEDASLYGHFVHIIDTDTMKTTYHLNPYALNFFKCDLTQVYDITNSLSTLPGNVLTIKVLSKDAVAARHYLDSNPNIISYRLIVEAETSEHVEAEQPKLETVDHLKQFETYIIDYVGDNNAIREELNCLLR